MKSESVANAFYNTYIQIKIATVCPLIKNEWDKDKSNFVAVRRCVPPEMNKMKKLKA